MKQVLQIFCASIMTSLLLSACSDHPDELCELPASVVGSPDLMGSPAFSALVISPGDTVTVSVPVDDETRTVMVDFAATGTTGTLDSPGFTDILTLPGGVLAAQTVDVDVIIPGSGVLTGDYYPVILLCNGDIATCSTTVAYAEDPTGFISQSNYVRGQGSYDQATSSTSFDSSSISNSCVPLGKIAIN